MILSSAQLSEQHQQHLEKKYPGQVFIFCDSMNEAEEHLPDAEILITYGADLTEELLSKASKLKWIMIISAGIEKLPFNALEQRDIIVTSARGVHKAPSSEYVFFMLMLVCRQGKQLISNEADKIWTRNIHMEEITGKSILIAGTGAIGQEVARIAKAFQMRTYGVSRSGKTVEYFDKTLTHDEMDKYMPEVDFVISILPSTDETRGFFNYAHFQRMPRHAVFMNIGRGDAVKEEEILKAVHNQEIAHAVLDVFEVEPLPENHPFWEEEKITVTSHLSGVSPNYHTRALGIFEENLERYLSDHQDYINKIDTSKRY
ncbi:D-2-hydroxyacid dehydrogenase [Alteribacillus sp. HJP-4]|uniref:D-2-hydroxyacid dehydrogenase n=1 Tax=Alteribacillus sp. HJP-4 TaxID=2775394 RepID=UPI0035CCD2B3